MESVIAQAPAARSEEADGQKWGLQGVHDRAFRKKNDKGAVKTGA